VYHQHTNGLFHPDEKDRWYVGGTPYYVAAVWYGYDQPKEVKGVSGNPAGRIYKKILTELHANLPDKSFPSASGVVARKYCKISGDLAAATCTQTATGYYRSSKLPATCKNCAMIHAIGSEIPDEATTEQLSTTTTEPTTVKPTKKPKPPKTTAPQTTLPETTVPVSTTEDYMPVESTTAPSNDIPPQTDVVEVQ